MRRMPYPARTQSERPGGAAGERRLEVEVALVARDEFAQRAPDAAVQTRELNHPVREGPAPEAPIEPPAHLRRAPQLPAKVRTPRRFVSRHVPPQEGFREKL